MVLCSSAITAPAGILFSALVRSKLRRSPYLWSNTGQYFCFGFCFNSKSLQAVTWGLQAAGCLLSSLAKGTTVISGKAFLPYSLALFHVSSWVNFEGFELQRGESTQPHSQGDFWAWQDKAISSFCMPSLDFLSASARLLVPAASFYYCENNRLANRDLSLQTQGRNNPNWYCRLKFAWNCSQDQRESKGVLTEASTFFSPGWPFSLPLPPPPWKKGKCKCRTIQLEEKQHKDRPSGFLKSRLKPSGL